MGVREFRKAIHDASGDFSNNNEIHDHSLMSALVIDEI